MVKIKFIILSLLSILLISVLTSNYSLDKDNETFCFPNKKKMAYISSWDDTKNINSFLYIIDICKQLNLQIPLTMFLNTNGLNKMNIIKYKSILTDKIQHVIESHSVSHPENPDTDIEYTKSQEIIRDIFGLKYAKTYCYPYGTISNKSKIKDIIKNTYIGARTTKTGYFNKKDMYDLPCIPIEKINENNIIKAINNNKAIITYGHGIKGISGWNPIDKTLFESHLNILSKYKDDIWFTTLPEFIEYLTNTKQI